MSLRFPSALGLALLLLAPPEGSAAEPPGSGKGEPPVFGTGVSLVSLPVFVTDKQGRAMRGLSAEDFELSDDGKPVRVVSFQYIDTTAPETQAEIREAPAARRHFLLLFDLSFTDPAGLQRSREAALDFVRHGLADSDLVAVATFDVNHGVRLVGNFSEDKGLMLHAIETLGAPSFARIADPLALAVSLNAAQVQENLSHRSGEDAATQAEVLLAAIARRLRVAEDELYRSQVLSLVDNLQWLGKSLRGVEGRKQIFYFSAGFDAQILVGNTQTSQMSEMSEASIHGRIFDVDSDTRYGDARLRDVMSTVTRTLSSADCVIHSVDVTGLGTDHSLSQMTVSEDPGRNLGGRESLNFLAAETGGRFFKDSNDLRAALTEVSDMTSRFYILGYQPEDLSGPGRFHKLKVKVLRRGSKVSHRAGFYEREPVASQTVMQRKFEAAQLVMTGVGPNTLRFSALCLPFPAQGERQTLGLVLQVPKDELRWEKPLALEVYGYAVGEDGEVKDHLAQLARFDPASGDPDGLVRGVSFYGTLQVPPGKYTLKLMVQEPGTGASGVQFIDVTVPPPDPRVGFLLPPVLVDEPRQWLVLNMGAGQGGRPDLPFALAGEGFLPRTTFRVTPGTPEKLVLMAYEPDRPSDPAAAVEIQTIVTDRSGRRFSTGPVRLERVTRDAGGRRTYLLGFTPDGLTPGDYTLRIGIGEAGAQLESYSLLRVTAADGPRR